MNNEANFEAGTKVTDGKRVGTVIDTYDDYYGNLYVGIKWDGAKRKSNVAAKNLQLV